MNSCAASMIACLVDLSLITSGLVEVIEADMGVIEADLSDQQYIDQELNRDEESPLLISMWTLRKNAFVSGEGNVDFSVDTCILADFM